MHSSYLITSRGPDIWVKRRYLHSINMYSIAFLDWLIYYDCSKLAFIEWPYFWANHFRHSTTIELKLAYRLRLWRTCAFYAVPSTDACEYYNPWVTYMYTISGVIDISSLIGLFVRPHEFAIRVMCFDLMRAAGRRISGQPEYEQRAHHTHLHTTKRARRAKEWIQHMNWIANCKWDVAFLFTILFIILFVRLMFAFIWIFAG